MATIYNTTDNAIRFYVEEKTILMKGRQRQLDESLITEKGVATEVPDAILDLLKRDLSFARYIKAGVLVIEENKVVRKKA